MKILAIIGLFVVVACGRVKTPDTFSTVKKFEPILVDVSHKNMLASICNQLAQKSVILDQTLGRSFQFSVARKSCLDEKLGLPMTEFATTARENQDYFFKQGQSYFGFQYVETNSSGIMKDVCSKLDNLTTPYKASNGTAVWLSFNPRREDCPIASGQTCLLFEIGSPDATSDFYNIYSRDWIRFISNPNEQFVGFFSYRKLRTKALCGEGKFQELEASLK